MHIVFDIGGTKMRIAASRDGETFGEPLKIETPTDDFNKAMEMIADTAREVSEGEKILAAAGGVRALDNDKKKLRFQPNFPLWVDEPLQERLSAALECPVYLENDSAMVGLGEAVSGAGKGRKIVAYITVSTGVGGARIVDSKIDANTHGFEPGMQIFAAGEDGTVIESTRGIIENYISGTAFSRKFGVKPYEVEDPAVWDEAARVLAIGLNNVAVFWSPDVMVLGGSMMVGQEGPVIPIDKVQEYFDKTLTVFSVKPQLVKAELGDLGGLHGALAYLKTL